MIGRRIKISKEDRRNIVEYLETMPIKIAEDFLKDVGLPAQMHKIIVLRFLKRNKIKDVEAKLKPNTGHYIRQNNPRFEYNSQIYKVKGY